MAETVPKYLTFLLIFPSPSQMKTSLTYVILDAHSQKLLNITSVATTCPKILKHTTPPKRIVVCFLSILLPFRKEA